MDISPLKSIGFKLKVDETERLIAILDRLNVNYTEHTSRETFVFLIEAVEKLLTQFAVDNQSDTTELIEDLELLKDSNQELSGLNSKLSENNQSLTDELRTITKSKQELTSLNLELTKNNQVLSKEIGSLTESNEALISEQETLSRDLKAISSKKSEIKVIEKAVPMQLGKYQLLIDLNYFQLALLAKVANHFAVESLFNKQAQLNPAAFVRVEGKPKERLS